MFCNLCGKPLPEGFKYVVCDPCFAERRQEVIYSGLQSNNMDSSSTWAQRQMDYLRNIIESSYPPGMSAGSGYVWNGIEGTADPPGMSAGSGYVWNGIEGTAGPPGMSAGSGYVWNENESVWHYLQVIPSDDDYIFSARAEKVKKEIEEKKLKRKRMIRIHDIEAKAKGLE